MDGTDSMIQTYIKNITNIIKIVNNAIDSTEKVTIFSPTDIKNDDPKNFIKNTSINSEKIYLEFSNGSGDRCPPYQLNTLFGSIRFGWSSMHYGDGCKKIFDEINKYLKLEKSVESYHGVWQGNGCIYKITEPKYSINNDIITNLGKYSYTEKCEIWKKYISLC